MDYKIGIVTNYDGFAGEITDKDNNNNKYIFLEEDLKDAVSENESVIFKGETINNINRAFHVKSLVKFKASLKEYNKKQ